MSMSSLVRDDAWNNVHRAETPLQRADRNFAELLQELRVVQTGAQILFGFLLTLSLADRFTGDTAFHRGLYVVALVATGATIALLLAPAALHRLLFQRGRKRELVRAAHRMVMAGLASLAVGVLTAMLLVLDVVIGRAPALAITGAMMAGVVVLWWGVPFYLRRNTD